MLITLGRLDEGFQARLVGRQPSRPSREMPQDVKHQKADCHVPDSPARGRVDAHGFAMVVAQVFKALEQRAVERTVADQHIGFQVQGQAQRVEVA
ncbi:hypothetical protein D3C80_2026170 [compost metagenome]